MKSIELTFKNGKKIQVVLGGNALIYQESDDTVIELGGGMGFNGGVKVKETPQEIADLINGKKDSGWVKHTGKAPNRDAIVEAKIIGRAGDMYWGKDSNIAYYKVIEGETE